MKLPREIDELMWDVAERDDNETLDQFVERYPEFRSELAKRLQMVRGLRGSRPTRPMPAFVPKQTVRNRAPYQDEQQTDHDAGHKKPDSPKREGENGGRSNAGSAATGRARRHKHNDERKDKNWGQARKREEQIAREAKAPGRTIRTRRRQTPHEPPRCGHGSTDRLYPRPEKPAPLPLEPGHVLYSGLFFLHARRRQQDHLVHVNATVAGSALELGGVQVSVRTRSVVALIAVRAPKLDALRDEFKLAGAKGVAALGALA